MPIRVVCSSCQCAFKVADAAAGKTGRCPRCKEPVVVPRAEAPRPGPSEPALVPLDDEDDSPYELASQARRPTFTARASKPATEANRDRRDAPLVLGEADAVTVATLTPAQILSAFGDAIEPVKPTLMYRLWILIVAVVMFLLPLIYVGLIVLVGYATYWHMTSNTGILESSAGSRRDNRGAFLLYFAPLLAGGFLIAFMIKPLFAKSGKGQKTRVLDPSKEPLLFAFIDGVCSTVGARTPSVVEVDCEVNASARYEGGPLSLFNNRLILRIGLPLVAGTDLRQFAGVLAHEFGHFSQTAGMRLSTMIRSINMWFARVVYERDAWDQNLENWSRGGDIRVMAIVWMFRGVVWLTRRVLWVLMMFGHMISGFLLRQMEFDADRYEARMVGGEVFESTCRKLQVLGVATGGAFSDLSESWREGRLADNLPKLVIANVAQIPPEAMAKIDDMVTAGKTGLFDTHPANLARIVRAHAEDTDGVFHLEGPASNVFRDFDSLCRAATFDFYKATFGKHGVDKEQLRPVADVVRTQEASMEGAKSLERFTQGVFDPFRPLLLPEKLPAAPDDLKAMKGALVSARDRMAATVEDYAEHLKQRGELRSELIKILAARTMLKSEFKIKASEFGLNKADLDSANQRMAQTLAAIEVADEALSIRESASIRRLHAALSMLESDPIAAMVPDGEVWRDECRVLYPVARHIGRTVLPALVEMFQAQQGLLGVAAKFPGNEQNEKMINSLRRGGRTLKEALDLLNTKLGSSVPYPFDHAEGMIGLSQYALPRTLPGADDIGDLLNVAEAALNKMIPLHFRVTGRLALAAEEVEKALGMPPLPERPKEESPES